MPAHRHCLLYRVRGAGVSDCLGVIEKLIVYDLGVLTDPDADALKDLHNVTELLRIDGSRQLVGDLVEGEISLLASFPGKESY